MPAAVRISRNPDIEALAFDDKCSLYDTLRVERSRLERHILEVRAAILSELGRRDGISTETWNAYKVRYSLLQVDLDLLREDIDISEYEYEKPIQQLRVVKVGP